MLEIDNFELVFSYQGYLMNKESFSEHYEVIIMVGVIKSNKARSIRSDITDKDTEKR